MTEERLDAVLDRLDALLAGTDDADRRRQIREIQQLVVGAKSESGTGQRDELGTERRTAQANGGDAGAGSGPEPGAADGDG